MTNSTLLDVFCNSQCGLTGLSRPIAAACIAIVFLIRFGVFNSITRFRDQGQEAMKACYTKHLGQDIADQFFSA